MWIVILPDEAIFCKTFYSKFCPQFGYFFSVLLLKKSWLYLLEYKAIYENLLFEHFEF